MTKHDFQLVSHILCPYVQRSIIVLKEKGIEYTKTDIELDNKPDWFLERSPMGRVPVLIVDQNRALFESAVICEYLDEVTPGSLHPDDPLEKAFHRSWIEFGSGVLNSIGKLYNAESEVAFNIHGSEIQNKFQQLEKELHGSDYFAGEKFHLIDAVYGPVFRYFDVFEKILVFDFFSDVPKVKNWRKRLKKRDSIINAVVPDYPELLLQFIKNRNSYVSQCV